MPSHKSSTALSAAAAHGHHHHHHHRVEHHAPEADAEACVADKAQLELYSVSLDRVFIVPRSAISHMPDLPFLRAAAEAEAAALAQHQQEDGGCAAEEMTEQQLAVAAAARAQHQHHRLLLCPHYDGARGDASCPAGAKCRYVHAALAHATSHDIHVNFAWNALEDVTYERLPPGQTLRVAAPNAGNSNDEVPSHLVIRTRAMQSGRRVMTHCAHFYFNRTCNRGGDCYFVHAVSLTEAAVGTSAPVVGSTERTPAVRACEARLWGRTQQRRVAAAPQPSSSANAAAAGHSGRTAKDGAKDAGVSKTAPAAPAGKLSKAEARRARAAAAAAAAAATAAVTVAAVEAAAAAATAAAAAAAAAAAPVVVAPPMPVVMAIPVTVAAVAVDAPSPANDIAPLAAAAALPPPPPSYSVHLQQQMPPLVPQQPQYTAPPPPQFLPPVPLPMPLPQQQHPMAPAHRYQQQQQQQQSMASSVTAPPPPPLMAATMDLPRFAPMSVVVGGSAVPTAPSSPSYYAGAQHYPHGELAPLPYCTTVPVLRPAVLGGCGPLLPEHLPPHTQSYTSSNSSALSEALVGPPLPAHVVSTAPVLAPRSPPRSPPRPMARALPYRATHSTMYTPAPTPGAASARYSSSHNACYGSASGFFGASSHASQQHQYQQYLHPGTCCKVGPSSYCGCGCDARSTATPALCSLAGSGSNFLVTPPPSPCNGTVAQSMMFGSSHPHSPYSCAASSVLHYSGPHAAAVPPATSLAAFIEPGHRGVVVKMRHDPYSMRSSRVETVIVQ